MEFDKYGVIPLKYANTSTYFVRGGLLVDTDYAGTLPAFYRAIKAKGIASTDIRYVFATHYHPDHMGLISDLMKIGVRLILIDAQADHVHFSDHIFARDNLPFTPIDASNAEIITCRDSRAFLLKIGIEGEIVSTPSHSQDSVSLSLDSGACVVGDLEPREYTEAYGENSPLSNDWRKIMSLHPERVFFAHRPARDIGQNAPL